ncbi:hypothetical protein [Tenacibaculum piscium]|uniref:hypothetical protein n=1 Tax=Tenacibaculum piscium TaxID=1458515 RepID=UPI001EFA59B6|nr:hypothetical protein [Tenacibaculum piscium]MCG8183455.1 hypothetical protein [Tenacibaculum piscium]MCG8205058.1 hypothetical protein [Tenacibaculum piscium]
MKLVYQIRDYFFWVILSLLSGIGYMRIVLGAKPKSSSIGILNVFDWIYDVVLFHVGLSIGSIIALLYVILDVFYLKKKFKNKAKLTRIRFLFFSIIVIIVGVIHHVLEKIIDVI